jgi:carbon storage regulator
VVTIVRVSGDKVRLGIEAPPDVLVLRDELEAQELPAAKRKAVLDVPSKPKMTSTTDLTLVSK